MQQLPSSLRIIFFNPDKTWLASTKKQDTTKISVWDAATRSINMDEFLIRFAEKSRRSALTVAVHAFFHYNNISNVICSIASPIFTSPLRLKVGYGLASKMYKKLAWWLINEIWRCQGHPTKEFQRKIFLFKKIQCLCLNSLIYTHGSIVFYGWTSFNNL